MSIANTIFSKKSKTKNVDHAALLAERIKKQKAIRERGKPSAAATTADVVDTKGLEDFLLPARQESIERPDGFSEVEFSIYKQALAGVFK